MQNKDGAKQYLFFSILEKMIVKDLLKTLLAVLSVIVIIIVSRQFAKILSKVVEGDIPHETILSVLALKITVATSEFLPAAIFIAIFMVLGRMYRDYEMMAVASAGGGVMVIYRAIFLLVFPVSIIASSLSMLATPWAEAKIQNIIAEGKTVANIQGIAAGRFSEYSHGDLVLYTEQINTDKHLSKIFVQTREADKIGIVNAKYGRLETLHGGLYLVMQQGERVRGVPGEQSLIIENFSEYAVRIKEKLSLPQQNRDGAPTKELWASNNLKDIAEMQQRLSFPLAVIFLSILAVPLVKISPRGGVYGNLLLAFAIYFIYGNLKRVSHSWVVNETIPVSIGYYGIYLLLLLLTIVLLIRLQGIKWINIMLKQWGII